ncbi:MAG: coiled-coil protein [Candidatus Hodarchaeales archaeon]
MSNQDIEANLLKISNIEANARDIKQQREELNRKVTTIANKRNHLNEQVKELIVSAKEEREKRDQCNQLISDIKEKKNIFLKELEGFDGQIQRLEEQLNQSQDKNTQQKRRPDISTRRIQKEIQDLEWKLQTTSNLSITEEREIVDQINRLEQRFREARESDVISRDIKTIYNRIRDLRGKLRGLDRDLRTKAHESRVHHKSMIQAFKNADVFRKQADELHAQFLDAKKQANLIHNEYLTHIREINKTRQFINKNKQKFRQKQDEERREKMKVKTEDAKKKFDQGRKLSFEEFRTLVDKGLI